MDYFKVYREMLSLRGLTDHTVKSYSTYIRSYLDYLQTVLCKQPEDVSWEELREYIRWLQEEAFPLRPYHKRLYLPAAFLYHVCSP